MTITSKTRSKVALYATTSLDPAASLALVKQAAEQVKGGGKSLLTSGVANVGATIHVEGEDAESLALSITSGKRLVELCTFSAQATPSNGTTSLRVGGLDRYKTVQSRLFHLIPTGPKRILGYDPYRRFLDTVRAALAVADPSATVAVGTPSA
jgi:hypothetical protein